MNTKQWTLVFRGERTQYDTFAQMFAEFHRTYVNHVLWGNMPLEKAERELYAYRRGCRKMSLYQIYDKACVAGLRDVATDNDWLTLMLT